jgi:predicted TIM-barrel fold metal-dependent hydrolase
MEVPAPIIDMHAHAVAADHHGPPPQGFRLRELTHLVHDPAAPWSDAFRSWFKEDAPHQVLSPGTDDELRDETIAVLHRRNIFAVTSGYLRYVDDWRQKAPDRIIPGAVLDVADPDFTPEELRALHAEGRVEVLGEVFSQYSGIEPDDPRFEPYLAVAEELDLPVHVHVGPGPPGAPYLGFPEYRARLHSPLLLEEPLMRHPRLRLYVGHAGWPMLDDTLALLWTHPRVYLDVGIISYGIPTAEFHRYLRALVEAGFGNRVMFGSDQMVWPDAIEAAIESIVTAEFLNPEQKRAILYENAARFLRLDSDMVARHHSPA